MELGKFIASKKFAKHEWAVNDCNTFIVEWHDQFYGTDHEGMLQFDYTSLTGAIRFHESLPFDAPGFMQFIGYKEVMIPSNGDVILVEEELGFFTAWLVLNKVAYSITHNRGFVGLPVEEIRQHSIWSYHEV